MASSRNTSLVVIAGAGPVGMTLATDLGRRGVDVLIVDPSTSTTSNPRCNTTNSRSMEYFRRLGVAEDIRKAGLPLDHPSDVVYVTTLGGHELMRFPFSSAQEILDGDAPEFDDWPTPEPQHRVSQIYLEPILERNMREIKNIEFRRGWAVTEVTQAPSHVTVTIRDTATGASEQITAAYLAGCDGGASVVRRAIGARLEGDATAAEERLSVYFRSPELLERLGPAAGWMYWWYGPVHRGSFLQLDGRGLFLLHGRVPVGTDPADLDPDDVMSAAIGGQVAHEKIDVIRWTPRRLVADRFVDGRIALAGDAAHLWLPLGGFGMNTGIADAMGLGWRLAALVAGVGGERLLADYEVERRSVGDATSRAALRIDRDMKEVGRDPLLTADTEAGAALRAEAGRIIEATDKKQWYSLGVQFGSRYTGSAGISNDSAPREQAISAIDVYDPSTDAGGRLPHAWLPGRQSLFDRLGPAWTLLRVGDDIDVKPLLSAAEDLNLELALVQLEPETVPAYQHRLVLVRPDMYVAWSGDSRPADERSLLAGLLGQVPGDISSTGAQHDLVGRRR